MGFLTIEEVAERLDMTVTQIRESRRKGEWPGNVGRLQGRRLRFRSELIDAGPQEPEITNDPTTALLWALDGIVRAIDGLTREFRKFNDAYTASDEEE